MTSPAGGTAPPSADPPPPAAHRLADASATGGEAGPPARLKHRPDFLRAAGGGRIHGRSFSLQVCRRGGGAGDPDGPRVGLTVTKKVGNAVERNRIKRRLREALRTPGLAAQTGHDYVVVARRDALSTPFAKLVGELRRCLVDAASGRAKASRPRGPAPVGPRRGKGGAPPARP